MPRITFARPAWLGLILAATALGAHAGNSGQCLSVESSTPVIAGERLELTVTVRNTGDATWHGSVQPAWGIILRGLSWNPSLSVTYWVWDHTVEPESDDSYTIRVGASAMPVAPGHYDLEVHAYYPVDASSGDYSLMDGCPAGAAFSQVSSLPPVPVQSVTLASGLPSPQLTGTAVAWTAQPVGGEAPMCCFWVDGGSGWSLARGYSPAPQWEWTPETAGTYRLRVWCRSAGSSDDFEAEAVSEPFEIQTLNGDVNGDRCVNIADLLSVRNMLGLTGSAAGASDVNADGVCNVADMLIVRNRLGNGPSCPH